jgi:hypothetical protein
MTIAAPALAPSTMLRMVPLPRRKRRGRNQKQSPARKGEVTPSLGRLS